MVVLQIRACTGWVIVALRGQLDTTGAADIAAAVTAAARPGQPVIVDLADLDYIDCSALGALAAARQLACRDGGDVVLAAPHGLVQQLLVLTGLDSVFGVYSSVATASAAVPAAAPAPGPPPHAIPVPRNLASHLRTRTEACHAART
jgi:anti-sigma B factor antagonist